MNGSPSPLGREVVHQERPLLALLAPIPYHDAGAIDHLPRITLAVQHACFHHQRISPQIDFLRFDERNMYITQEGKKKGQTHTTRPTRPTTCRRRPGSAGSNAPRTAP